MRVLSDDGTPLTHAELLSLLEQQGVAPGRRKREAQPFQAKLYDYLASSTPAPHAPREALAAFALEASKLGLSVSQAAAAANLVPTREVDAFAIAPSLDESTGAVVAGEGSDANANGTLPLIEACKVLKAASDSAAEEKARKRAEEEATADKDEAEAAAEADAAAAVEEDE